MKSETLNNIKIFYAPLCNCLGFIYYSVFNVLFETEKEVSSGWLPVLAFDDYNVYTTFVKAVRWSKGIRHVATGPISGKILSIETLTEIH